MESLPVVITTDSLVTIEGETRILDTDLAAALGIQSQRTIRTVIQDNRTELESFGSLMARPTNSGTKGGRPENAFLLNEEQAVLITMLSRTERAKQVRADIIRVFVAYRRGSFRHRPRSLTLARMIRWPFSRMENGPETSETDSSADIRSTTGGRIRLTLCF